MRLVTLRLSEERALALETARQTHGLKTVADVIYKWVDSYKEKAISGGRVKRCPTPAEVSRARKRWIEFMGKEPSPEVLALQIEDEDLGITATAKDIERAIKSIERYARYNEKRKPSKES